MAKPQGVRIVRQDGSVLPVDLIHLGENENGTDQWEIAGVQFHPGRDQIKMDVFPARTSVRFAAALPDREDT